MLSSSKIRISGRIFDQLKIEDASQAFYMGKELQKARLAMQLGKKYTQEAELRWGYLSEGGPRFPLISRRTKETSNLEPGT